MAKKLTRAQIARSVMPRRLYQLDYENIAETSTSNYILGWNSTTEVWEDKVITDVGCVTSGGSSTDHAIPRWDGTTGYLLQDSDIIIADTTNNVSGMGTLGCGAITSTGAIADGAASTFTTGAAIGTLTLGDGSIVDSGGSISFNDENLTTTGDITVALDNKSTIYGTGSDMKIYYDGAAGNIDTDIVAPSDLTIDCGTDKTVVLEESVWDDVIFPLVLSKIPAANFPGWAQVTDDGAGSVGAYAYHFADAEYVWVTQEMPHDWKEGTTIYPHIHFECTSDVDPSDNFGVELEYTWTDMAEDRAANTTVDSTDVPTGVNTDTMHQLYNIGAGIAGTNLKIGSIFNGKLGRVAAGADNYADDVIIYSFGIHYEIDTVGSRTTLVK